MTWMDHALVLSCALAWPLRSYLEYAKFKARVRAGIPGERLAGYARAMITQWLLVAATTALWIHLGRDWQWLGLTGLSERDSWMALGVAVLLAAFFLLQSASVARRPEMHEQVRKTMRPVAELLPVERTDLTGFLALSVTAGVCEEILFRGLLGWYFGSWLGLWGGQAVALAIFAAAHAYLGVGGAVRALIAGAAAAGSYVWSGSLVPSILLHAIVDISSGWMAYEVFHPRPADSLIVSGARCKVHRARCGAVHGAECTANYRAPTRTVHRVQHRTVYRGLHVPLSISGWVAGASAIRDRTAPAEGAGTCSSISRSRRATSTCDTGGPAGGRNPPPAEPARDSGRG